MSLTNRNFVKELDFTGDELAYLLALAAELKADRCAGTERPRLTGRHIALIFERASTRTRCAFEVAARDQGAHITSLDPGTTHFGTKESAKDTARVLGRLYDGILYRGDSHQTVEELARHAGVPVWNGLTGDWHPTQMLADMLTMLEHSPGKARSEITYAFLGDARSNLGRSYLVTGALLGMGVRIVAPKPLWPDEQTAVRPAREAAATTGARLLLTEDVAAGVRGVDFVVTDVWASMGDPWEVWAQRIDLLRPYQVTAEVLAASGNPQVKFMHCLPAFHDGSTPFVAEVSARTGLAALEVTDDVFESPASVVFDEAENRMHTIKALMIATMGSPPSSASGSASTAAEVVTSSYAAWSDGHGSVRSTMPRDSVCSPRHSGGG